MSTTEQEVATDDSAPAEPFHIVCNQETSDPVMWIGICVDDVQMKQFLRDNDVLNPYLLVVVTTPAGHEIERHITPLTHGIVHHAFRRAGEFKVMATVVYEPTGDVSKLRRLFNYKDATNDYDCSVIDVDGELFRKFRWYRSEEYDEEHRHEVKRHPYVSTTTVTVHPNNFAQERAAWRVALVNTFFRKRGQDECNWRKRWLASLVLCVVWVPLQYLFKVLGLVLFGVTGFVYGLDMSKFIRAGRHGSVSDMFVGVDKHTWWWFRRDESSFRDFKERNPVWSIGVTLMAIWVVATLLVSLIPNVSITQAMVRTALGIGAVVLVIAIVVLFFYSVERARDHFSSPEHRAQKRAKRDAKKLARMERQKDKRGDVERQLESLSCSATGQPMTIDRLLQRRKTSRVVIWNKTKDAVCKPFQEQ